jgi:hypothetical protein
VAFRSRILRFARSAVGSPEYDRLASSIARNRTRFEAMQRLTCVDNADGNDWVLIADRNLRKAEQDSETGHFDNAWIALTEAKQSMLRGPLSPQAANTIAITLRREADAKLSGWRAKAVRDLICDAENEVRVDLADRRENLVEALRLLDDQFETTRHRISLRRRHLQNLLCFLLLALVAIGTLSALGHLPGKFSDIYLFLNVMLGGVIGACLSVAQSLMQSDLDKRIPSQMVGAFVVWMRPIVGAAAAIAAFALIEANAALKLFTLGVLDDPSVLFAIALLAGYSERFIMGALDHLSDTLGEKK